MVRQVRWVPVGVEGSLVDTSGVADYSGSDAKPKRYSTSKVNNSPESPRAPSESEASIQLNTLAPKTGTAKDQSSSSALCHAHCPQSLHRILTPQNSAPTAHGPRLIQYLPYRRQNHHDAVKRFGGLGLVSAQPSQPNKPSLQSVESWTCRLSSGRICTHAYTLGPDLRLPAAGQDNQQPQLPPPPTRPPSPRRRAAIDIDPPWLAHDRVLQDPPPACRTKLRDSGFSVAQRFGLGEELPRLLRGALRTRQP
ncbi:uncharacterized protein J3D65DRAFT_115221 [Phyllosticta citribraziliensis]|uniref:Uncharacterized protein n=1 Tax=Phyllosticta citribraziliensis TaxID=989973 RepID=A0ABR1L870_9PEZI